MAVLLAAASLSAAAQTPTIKAVVVTGGHAYDKNEFPKLFAQAERVDIVYAEQRDDSELFEDIETWPYDVIILYHMTRKIGPKRQANLLKLLEDGVGLVALHHAMSAFRDWPEYGKIIGGKYVFESFERDGVEYPAGSYKHDVDFDIYIADAGHAVTEGVEDFTVHDETYKNCFFESDNHVLLTTDHPTSDRTVGWTRTYGNARICTIQMGHGPQIFAHPSYQRLVAQAIRYCARAR